MIVTALSGLQVDRYFMIIKLNNNRSYCMHYFMFIFFAFLVQPVDFSFDYKVIACNIQYILHRRSPKRFHCKPNYDDPCNCLVRLIGIIS